MVTVKWKTPAYLNEEGECHQGQDTHSIFLKERNCDVVTFDEQKKTWKLEWFDAVLI